MSGLRGDVGEIEEEGVQLGKLPVEIERGKDLNMQTVPPEIPPGLPAELLERRPDIRRADISAGYFAFAVCYRRHINVRRSN